MSPLRPSRPHTARAAGLLVGAFTAACEHSDDVAAFRALTAREPEISCTADDDCPPPFFCYERMCRESHGRRVGAGCDVGPDCEAGLVCLKRQAGGSGTCESVVHRCGSAPRPGQVCADVLACAPSVCEAFVGAGGFSRVICGARGERDPAQANVTLECGIGVE